MQAISIFFFIFAAFCVNVLSDTIDAVPENGYIIIDKVIYKGSLLISDKDKILLEGADYKFKNGKIEFMNDIADTLTLIFSPVPDGLLYINSVFFQNSDSLNHDTPVYAKSEDTADPVLISGIKGFSVSQSQGVLNMSQSLEVNIQGNLKNNWNVSGYIYDNSAEFNGSGLNLPISQIENIYVSLYDSKTNIALGNNRFFGFNDDFNKFSREIFGIKLSSEIINLPFSVSIAGQKGKFSSKSFYCENGVQGPYLITETVSLFDYVIAPSSEIVYLDGEKMKSGIDNDYVVDYYSGELTFTNKRIVDKNSFVYIEYQTYENLTPVTGYYGSAGSDSSNVKFLFAHEEQSVNDTNLINRLTLTESDSSYILLEGYKYVGDGFGDYFFIDSIFYYAGTNNGDYSVEFYFSGINKGDYLYDPITKSFIYAGYGLGDYSYLKSVELPFRSDYMSLSYSQNTLFGKFTAESGGGFYKFNKYSSVDSPEKDLSYGAKYDSPVFIFSPIALSFNLNRSYSSDIFRKIWSSKSKSDLDYLYQTSSSLLPGIKTGFVGNIIYDNIFGGSIGYSVSDSTDEKSINLKSDTLMNMFAVFSHTNRYMQDSLLYSSLTGSLGRSFKHFNISVFDEEESKNIMFFRRVGIRNVIKSNLSLFEYSRKYVERNDTLSGISDIFKSDILFSTRGNNITLVTEYKIMSDFQTDKKSQLFAFTANGNGTAEQAVSYYQRIYITSVSSYEITETYVYVGAGKGNYIYDETSETYIYDAYYGDYVKISRNQVSANPVSRREYTLNMNSENKKILMKGNLKYSDNSLNFYSIKKIEINNSLLNLSGMIGYEFNDFFTPYLESQITDDKQYEETEYYNRMLKGGVRGDNQSYPYQISYSQTKESSQNIYAGGYELNSEKYSGEISPYSGAVSYTLSLQYTDFSGYYDYSSTGYKKVKGRGIRTDINMKYAITRLISVSLSPNFALNTYSDGADAPLSIYYKYPDGFNSDGTFSLIFSNDLINLTVSYINQFEKRNGFRQRAEFSLFTYF